MMKAEPKTYIATCAACHGCVGASVCDPSIPQSAARAARDAMTWQRQGLDVRLGECEEVRQWAGPLGHANTCIHAKKRKAQRTPSTGATR